MEYVVLFSSVLNMDTIFPLDVKRPNIINPSDAQELCALHQHVSGLLLENESC